MAALLLSAVLLLDGVDVFIAVWLTGAEDVALEISIASFLAQFVFLSGCCSRTAEGAVNPIVKMRAIPRELRPNGEHEPQSTL